MKTNHKAVAPLIAALLIMLVTAVATAPRPAQGDDRGIDRLPGAWHAVTTPSGFGPFPALLTFTSDGALIASEPPGPFESPAHGNWVRRGRDVACTFFVLFGGPLGAGQTTGSAKIVGTLLFDAHSGGWSGPFRIQVFTPAGVAVFSNTGTVELTRIEIESL